MTLSRLAPLALLLAACSNTPEPSNPSTSPSSTTTAPPPATTPPPSSSSAAVDFSSVESAIKAGDGAKARKLADELLVKNPKNPQAHTYAGLGAELSGDREAAEKHYRDALALSPGFTDAAINLSVVLIGSKRAGEAVTLLKPFVTKSPDDELLQNNYATALAESGDSAQAAEIYGRLAQKGKLPPEGRLAYAGTLLAGGKKDEAAKALREGISQVGDSRDLLAAFGRALAQAGAYDDAIKALDRALQIKSGADLLTYRALFKRSQKNPEGARADLEAAIKEDPKFPPAYRYLGEVLEDLKKPADAKKAYEKAVELDADGSQGKKARERLDAMKKK